MERSYYGAWAEWGLASLAQHSGQRAIDAPARHLRTSWLAGIGAPLLTAVAYFLAAKLGERLAFPSAPLSVLWAPNAIVLAALLMTRRQRWWIYLLAILPSHFLAQLPEVPVAQVVIQYVINSMQAVLGAWAISRFCPAPCRFDRVRAAVVLTVLGGIAAPLVTSVLMAAAFLAIDLTREFGLTVIGRTITNTFAVVTLVPLIVHGVQRVLTGRQHSSFARTAEAGALAACLAAVCFLVFAFPGEGMQGESALVYAPALLYAPVPLLAWAAIRFGIAGVCGAVLVVGALSTWGTLNGHGPFTAADPVQKALSLVSFHAVTGVAFVIFAALLEEWKHAGRALDGSEAQRLRAESLHSAVLASLHDEVAIIDNSGTVIDVNEPWSRAVETTPARFERVQVGDDMVAACTNAAEAGDPTAAEMLGALRAVLDGAEARRLLEFPRPSPDDLRWFELSVERLRRPDGGAVVTRTDVTARKQAEIESRNQQQQLTFLGRAAILGQLSGAFAHELNQPLTSILGNAEAGLRLLADGSGDTHEIREILRDIAADDERAAHVLHRLRALLGKAEAERLAVDLNAVVRTVLDLMRTELILRNIQFTTSLDAHLPLVMADRVQMQQVVLNLVVNACEAMADVPVTNRKIALATRWLPQEHSAEITVSDSGGGIPPTEMDRIFQPFVSTKPQGMGLGLTISRSVVESHHGRLWAENGASGGAAFHLRIPVEAR